MMNFIYFDETQHRNFKKTRDYIKNNSLSLKSKKSKIDILQKLFSIRFR